MLLQSAEPTLSDKDYAALRTSSSPSAVASSAMYPVCRSPKFDEDEEELADLKLIPGKGRAQEFSEDALMLPKSFMDLEVIFEQMLKILASAHARRKKHTPLDSLKGDMASMYVQACLNPQTPLQPAKFCSRNWHRIWAKTQLAL